VVVSRSHSVVVYLDENENSCGFRAAVFPDVLTPKSTPCSRIHLSEGILTNDIWKADMMLMKNRKKKVFLKPYSIEENRAHTYLCKKIMHRVSYVVLQQHDNISTNGTRRCDKENEKNCCLYGFISDWRNWAE